MNGPPAVTITAPADASSSATEGADLTLNCIVVDEDGDLSDALTWTSSLDGALGTGDGLTTSALSLGTHTITAAVSDSRGLPGSDQITVTVNANVTPTVSITAPADGTTEDTGSAVTFSGSASDPEDGDLTTSLAWSSDLDGALGTGASVTTSALSVGTHTITGSVTDSLGAAGSSTITLTVNGSPAVAITAPADGSSSTETTPVTFTGTASDEDGDLAASLAWTSSLDGALGTGASVTTSALSIGTHTITAAVSDSRGLPGSAQITVTVNANVTPTVSITAPADGTTEDTGTAVTFSGSASDPEDGDLTTSLVWSSDLDGALGTGASVTTSALSVGTHTLTASVTDSLGAAGSSTITLTVNGSPAVAITAPADASSATEGADLTLTASVVDEDDLAASLAWTSSLDGALGTGASITTSALAIGIHTITAAASDSRGLPGSDSDHHHGERQRDPHGLDHRARRWHYRGHRQRSHLLGQRQRPRGRRPHRQPRLELRPRRRPRHRRQRHDLRTLGRHPHDHRLRDRQPRRRRQQHDHPHRERVARRGDQRPGRRQQQHRDHGGHLHGHRQRRGR